MSSNHITDAVTRGLDFYRLLGVPAQADMRVIARRYQYLRARFPAASSAQPMLGQRLTLLEVAGRMLTDPQLRQQYDDLRTRHAAQPASGELRCTACGAFLQQRAACSFCGTTRPAEQATVRSIEGIRPLRSEQAAAAPKVPEPSPTAETVEPIDYYAILGLIPSHLYSQPSSTTSNELLVAGATGAQLALRFAGIRMPLRSIARLAQPSQPQVVRPPTAKEIDAAAQAALQQIMAVADFTPTERATLIDSISVARHILSDNQRRGIYDSLLRDFQAGKTANGQLNTLLHLQTEARAAIGAARGEPVAAAQIDQLLQQGQDYLDRGKWHHARDALKQVVQARPDAIAAHAGLVRAVMLADDVLVSGPYQLNLALKSIGALEQHNAALANTPALTALFQGLLARDTGDTQAAEAALQQALAYDPQLTLAWRVLAVIALGQGAIDACVAACQRGLATAPQDEPTLMLLMGAYLRGRRRDQAAGVASQIAKNRGGSWTAEAVLREIGL